jgi:hypothetical protein
LLVTVCVIAVWLIHVTRPPGRIDAAGNGAELLTMLTVASESGAASFTVTVPVITP